MAHAVAQLSGCRAVVAAAGGAEKQLPHRPHRNALTGWTARARRMGVRVAVGVESGSWSTSEGAATQICAPARLYPGQRPMVSIGTHLRRERAQKMPKGSVAQGMLDD